MRANWMRVSGAVLLVLAVLGSLALGSYALWQQGARAAVYRMAPVSPAAAAELIAAGWPQNVQHCRPPDATVADREHLISALFSLERFARTPLEGEIEWMIAHLTAALGVMPPDLSYGPGQIRLSRALALDSLAGSTASAPGPARPMGAVVTARALLADCTARHYARGLLQLRATGGPLTRDEILESAAAYSGFSGNATASPEARLSARIYGEITYHLVQHYRFLAR